MDKSQLVSIVIPVYNSERFLAQCLDSVLNQTYKFLEIIVINDGSTDDSLKILQKHSDKITIIDQKNQGLASSLNAGINAMSGKWFKWFSPDDLMYPNTIELLVETAKTLPENTIVYSNWEIIDETGKTLRNFKESNYNNLGSFDFNVRLLDGQQINVNTTLIPKTLFSDFKMNENINPVLVDYDLFLHAGIIKKTKFYLIENPLIKFRVHQNQLSHKNILNSLNLLKSTRNEILRKISNDQKIRYLEALNTFGKNKPLSKKSMELGLKIISLILPSKSTDKILVFYLNKLRRSR